MRVYIAGPYTKGDVALNVRAAIDAANYIANQGHIPFVPHLTHFWHMVAPRVYKDWLRIDMAWLEQSEAVLRLHGESNGADREIERAISLGLPTLYLSDGVLTSKSLDQIDTWLQSL